MNELDNCAVKEAIQLRDKIGGAITGVTVVGECTDEVLRRELAMYADKAVHLNDEAATGSNGRGLASILKALAFKEAMT